MSHLFGRAFVWPKACLFGMDNRSQPTTTCVNSTDQHVRFHIGISLFHRSLLLFFDCTRSYRSISYLVLLWLVIIILYAMYLRRSFMLRIENFISHFSLSCVSRLWFIDQRYNLYTIKFIACYLKQYYIWLASRLVSLSRTSSLEKSYCDQYYFYLHFISCFLLLVEISCEIFSGWKLLRKLCCVLRNIH